MPFSRWVFLTVPAFVVCAVLLGFAVRSLLRTLSRSAVVAMPVAPSQTFRLDQPGPYDLYVEGSFATDDFAGLGYALADSAGRALPMSGVLFRTSVRGFSRSRLQVQSFEAPAAGLYTLRVTGIHSHSAPANRIRITRPVRGAMVLHILALIVLGIGTIGSMVATGILVFGLDKRGAA